MGFIKRLVGIPWRRPRHDKLSGRRQSSASQWNATPRPHPLSTLLHSLRSCSCTTRRKRCTPWAPVRMPTNCVKISPYMPSPCARTHSRPSLRSLTSQMERRRGNRPRDHGAVSPGARLGSGATVSDIRPGPLHRGAARRGRPSSRGSSGVRRVTSHGVPNTRQTRKATART